MVARQVKLRCTEPKEVNRVESAIVARLVALKLHNVPAIRNIRREFSRQLAESSPTFILALALRLKRSKVVPLFFAYELVQHHRETLHGLRAQSLEDLGSGIDSWVGVDTFACYLAGPAWREQQVSDELIRGWARSPDRWWRRAAVVSTVPLNNKARGGSGDTDRTLNICRMLIADRDDMVVKALSWALRELSKRDPESVSGFLQEHESRLTARVVREVSNKLQTGLKNPRQQRT